MSERCTIFALLLCLVFFSACTNNDEGPPATTVLPTTIPTEAVTTDEVSITDQATDEASDRTSENSPLADTSTAEAEADSPTTQTEEVSVTEVATEELVIEVNSVCPDNSYYIAVSYKLDEADGSLEESSDLRTLEAGTRWIVVTATLGNESGSPVEVGADDVVMIDTAGNRYQPEVPDQSMEPQLVGSQLAEGESVYGFARFAIPETATPELLEWSPGEDCGLPIQSYIP